MVTAVWTCHLGGVNGVPLVLRKIALLLLFAVAGSALAVVLAPSSPAQARSAAARPSFNLRATVTRVVDGDTLVVQYGKRTDRVRLIGIDSPEVGTCYAAEATAVVQRLAFRRVVRLLGDGTQARRDRYGRLLAYVGLPNGRDLGRESIGTGAAVVYVYDRPFTRLQAYRAAEATARQRTAGLWGGCRVAPPMSTTTTTPTSRSCAASYPDVCITPPPPDLDCGQIPFKGFRVRYDVPSPDPHRFDGDRDGIGCES
jgi:endonuclease YncB( thermonuclease family)